MTDFCPLCQVYLEEYRLVKHFRNHSPREQEIIATYIGMRENMSEERQMEFDRDFAIYLTRIGWFDNDKKKD
jgi:hypothetical protein